MKKIKSNTGAATLRNPFGTVGFPATGFPCFKSNTDAGCPNNFQIE